MAIKFDIEVLRLGITVKVALFERMSTESYNYFSSRLEVVTHWERRRK